MDPIDRIAQAYVADCEDTCKRLRQTIAITNRCASFAQAAAVMRRRGMVVDDELANRLWEVPYDLQNVERCIASMPEIVAMARRVLVVSFYDDERFLTFNQEVCFSYACKMVAAMGPRRSHFSNSASLQPGDIQRAEIHLAVNAAPGLYAGKDLFCYEVM